MTRKTQLSPAALAQKNASIAQAMEQARMHHLRGSLPAAEGLYRQALALEPNNADAIHMLGLIAFQSGQGDEGIRLMKIARRKNPSDVALLVNLGAAYRNAARHAEAREVYKQAVRLKPDLWEAQYNYAQLLYATEEFEEAIKRYRICTELDPSHPDAYVALGNACKMQGDGDGALEAYEAAVKLKPNMPEALGNIAAVMVDRGKFIDALTLMNNAVALSPEPGELRFKRSLIALRLEEFSTGWRDYESRFFADTERIPCYPMPPTYWTGEDISDKTILVWMEQGLGDEILYGSMLPDLIARAGKCIIECSPRMVPVFARSFPEAKVLRYQSQGVRATPVSEVDVQLGVPSLGQYFRPNAASFPKHRGFLKADPEQTKALQKKYRAIAPGNLVVGLSWRSKNTAVGRGKSADLAEWEDVLSVPGVTFINLQYGECEDEIRAVKDKFGVTIFNDADVNPLKSMDAFFSQVAAMDAVVTTSNTTVHVAGSLSIPTWLLLPTGPAGLWYWFLERADSPWYPSVKVVRKPDAAKEPWWRHGVAQIGRALAAKVAVTKQGASS